MGNRSTRFVRTAAIFGVGLLTGCGPPPPLPKPASQPAASALKRPATAAAISAAVAAPAASAPADFDIRLDRTAMAAQGVDAAAVTAALSRFFEAYPFFSLSDLQDVKVRATDGREVPLRQLGTVDVWFSAARTEIVIGRGKR
jgi:hypothetical protein